MESAAPICFIHRRKDGKKVILTRRGGGESAREGGGNLHPQPFDSQPSELCTGVPMWLYIFCVSTAALSLLSLGAVIFVARRAAHAQALPLVNLRSVESRLASFENSLADQATALEAIANRVKMMKVRNAANHVESSQGEPDPFKDPDRWRAAMNSKLARNKHGL